MTGAGIDVNGLEILDRSECLDLLGTVSLARVGVVIDALPAILPVRFALDRDQVVIRASGRSRLPGALRDAVVAVQAEHFADDQWSGWSVLVRGWSRELVPGSPREVALGASVAPWRGSGEQDRWFMVATESVTGRRLPVRAQLARPAAPAR